MEKSVFTEGGQEILLKAVIQAIPTFDMSCFRIPCTILKEIKTMYVNFWWGSIDKGKKIHWKAWNFLQKPKTEGGLGFRILSHFNKALLEKKIWRLLDNPNSLVAQVFKARYYKHTDIMEATIENSRSYIWRSLMWSRDVLNLGVMWKVGNEKHIHTRRDA